MAAPEGARLTLLWPQSAHVSSPTLPSSNLPALSPPTCPQVLKNDFIKYSSARDDEALEDGEETGWKVGLRL